MRDHSQTHQAARFWMLFTVAFLAMLAAIFLGQPFTSASGESAVATYSNGVLHVSIPYRADRSGAGRLEVEVLNPEDAVVGRLEQPAIASSGQGRWQADVKLPKPLALDDLVWHRVRYSFDYDNGGEAGPKGIESVSEIIRTPVVHILGQQSYLAGGQAAVRVIVTDSKNEAISGPGTVRIQLLEEKQQPRQLFSGRLNRRGTTEAQFQFPAGMIGNYQLRYVVDTPIGSTEFTQPVRLDDKVSVLLTTEKPLYQPGQTIHVRALALDRSNHEAAADRTLTFEVEDSRGNKVFKKVTRTDKFGIASAEFGLADEINLGAYHLRSLIGDMDAPANTSEITLNVERYVLPKFKVAVDLAGKNNKARRGYRPGDHVTGTVRANYFFGKPVEGEVTVKASAMDVAVFDAGAAQGKTDRDGAYHFDFILPAYFAGRPLTQGAARVLVEATVKDSAGHAETRGEPIMVSESPLLITAVPEGGTLVPRLENEVFVLASYPDGTPAQASLNVHTASGAEQRVQTDESGVAIIRVNAGTGQEMLDVEANDQEGNHALVNIPLQSRTIQGDARILLRTERAVYRAGDRVQLRVFSTQNRGTAYIDIVKEGQTVLTRDVDIVDGQAELALIATPEMAGTVDVSAYVFGRDARPVGDHRLVFVQPADELKVEAAAENAVYKPGQDARVRFRVTNARGQGVQAALGLQVVDDAVFALAEKQPGFAKVFFYLEQEVLKPRYEIHSIGMSDIVEPTEKAKAEQRDRAARALFSATEMVNPNKFETEFGRSIPQTKSVEYSGRYITRFTAQARKVAELMNREFANAPEEKDGVKIFTRMSSSGNPELRDSWYTPLRVSAVPFRLFGNQQFLELRSAGPDKQFNTADDFVAYLEVQRAKIVTAKHRGASKIEATIEHDRGAMNGLAGISGTAVDQEGRALDGASVRVTEAATGKVRTALVNADGRFSVNGLTPGDYQVEVVTQAQTVTKKISLEARDRAVLSAFLGREAEVPVVIVSETFKPVRVQGFGDLRLAANAGAFDNRERMVFKAMPSPPAASETIEVAAQSTLIDTTQSQVTNTFTGTTGDDKSAATHVRSYFPEALYINPEIITDGDGRASVSIPLADSITTWRMAMLVSTRTGALGSGTSSLKVFQDFFVDLDLPVTLTQGDRVSIPVAVYNYAGERGGVDLKLQPENWYALVDDTAEKSVSVDPSRVGGSQFTLEARRIGKFKLTLSAQMKGGAERADVVVREIEVVPNGREQNLVFNGRLEQTAQHDLNFPASAVPDASKIFVRLYPGPLSQVIEGMDSLLRMPFGCFEQTSSSTYPNVLALDYMKRTKKLTPEVHAKAEGFIANGYQRLLTFEVAGGGFSWFGNAPANKILTAYGLMEFSDMSKVHDVDPKLIARTQQWLAAQQQADGSWKPDTQFINEGATNRYNSDSMRITAYIAWSLQNTGYHGPAVDRAKDFIEKHMGSGAKLDPYTLAVLANFAVDYGRNKDSGFTTETMQMLIDARHEKDDQAWWTSEETGVYSTGASASVETTALATQALLKWGQASGTARKALAYIAAKKDAQGAWGTTQATIMALRALLLATEKGSADVHGTVEVVVNGKTAQKLVLNDENNDLLHQYVFTAPDSKGASRVELRFEGKGGLAYQVVGRYFIPWDEKPAGEPLNIDVAYDRTHLAQDDIATATATIRNNLGKPANMVMVDLGIPPGFDLLSEDLQSYIEKSAHQKSGRLEKFSLTATQAILYFDSFAPGDAVKLSFRLRAKYPIRAKTFESRVYEYYDPDVNSVARPVQLEVRGQ